MKIDDKVTNYEVNNYLSNASRAQRTEEESTREGERVKGEERTETRDTVDISGSSRDAQMAREVISSEPDVREEKVSEVKEQIESDQYEVDNQEVADRMVGAFIDEVI